MNCYDCHPRQTPAVAMCMACGKGICMDHLVRHERDVVAKVSGGMTTVDRPTGRKVPRMLCGECAGGMQGNVCPQRRD